MNNFDCYYNVRGKCKRNGRIPCVGPRKCSLYVADPCGNLCTYGLNGTKSKECDGCRLFTKE